MMGDSNFSNFIMCCRLCLSKNLDFVKSILDDQSLQQKISTSVGVKVQQGDRFSTMICVTCVVIINRINEFKQSCLDNQLKLEQWLHLQDYADVLVIEDDESTLLATEEDIESQMPNSPNASDHSDEDKIDIDEEEPKRPRKSPMPILLDEEEKDKKVINPMSIQKMLGTKCPICPKKYASNFNMRRHYQTHAAGTPEDTRDDSFKQVKKRVNKKHVEKPKKLTKEKAKQYSCKICRKTFKTNTALCAHQSRHKRAKNTKKFVRSSKAMPKLTNVKEKAKPCKVFQCNICNSKLLNDAALQIHISKKHQSDSATVAAPRCAVCSLDFSTQEDYDRHRQFHIAVKLPQTKKSYPCSNCTLVFRSPDTLDAHIIKNHKYFCNLCDRIFDKQTQLSIHLKVHEKQKAVAGNNAPKPKFSCAICNKGFQLPKDLRAHIIQAHPF